jgi:hypothetical protein
MTPRELWLYVENHKAQQQQDFEHAIIHAYHTARFYRAKKMPSLRTVLSGIRKKQYEKAQSPDEMLSFAKRFMANLEGKE